MAGTPPVTTSESTFTQVGDCFHLTTLTNELTLHHQPYHKFFGMIEIDSFFFFFGRKKKVYEKVISVAFVAIITPNCIQTKSSI